MIFFLSSPAEIETKIPDIGKNIQLEVFLSAEEAIRRRIDAYWTCLDFIDFQEKEIRLFNLSTKEYQKEQMKTLHNLSSVILFKTIGSVESKLPAIEKGMSFLKEHYKGTVINDCDTIVYGSRKNYLIDLQNDCFPVIKTSIYHNTVSMRELQETYVNMKNYIIKPLTGELSNSLSVLDDVNEEWLRHKQNKVGGWVVQPIEKDIWKGEYQLVFFDDTFSHGQIKQYQKNGSSIPSQKTRSFIEYTPSREEIDMCLRIRNFMREKMKKEVHYFRCDYLKREDGTPAILEFEMVNPGFFLMYQNREKAKNIASSFIDYLTTKM